jgi:hypothetical protein
MKPGVRGLPPPARRRLGGPSRTGRTRPAPAGGAFADRPLPPGAAGRPRGKAPEAGGTFFLCPAFISVFFGPKREHKFWAPPEIILLAKSIREARPRSRARAGGARPLLAPPKARPGFSTPTRTAGRPPSRARDFSLLPFPHWESFFFPARLSPPARGLAPSAPPQLTLRRRACRAAARLKN